MSRETTFVIVGAGLAGAKAAEALRTEGFDGRLVLLGAEKHRPYERPPLSKDYLQGTSERDDLFVHSAEWYAEQDVDLRPATTATALDRREHEVVIADGERLAYAKLLLTTGAQPRRLDIPGARSDLLYLRNLEDSDRVKASFTAGTRVVIVGAGWIGLETAAAARAAGAQVTVLEHAELPLLRVLGPAMASVFADLHRERGVDLRCGVTVTGIDAAGAVRLADGVQVNADVIIVGVGVAPDIRLAQSSGLAVDNGILVDAHLQSSDADIYAAGDVANAYHPLLRRHLRVEHWANAMHQPAVAAQSMLGHHAVYDRLPYFFTDQYDLGMEYTGYADPDGCDRVVTRGDVHTREFIAFWLCEGRVVAGMNVNVWDVTDPIERLIRSGRRVDPARLGDLDVALDDVID